MPKRNHIICKNCGKKSISQNNIFCNHKCHHEYTLKSIPPRVCIICGKVFITKTKQRSDKQKCCSGVCKGKWLSRLYAQEKLVTICKVCGNSFKHLPNVKRIFCSSKCKVEFYRGRHLKDGVTTEINCKQCGVKLTIRSTRLKRNYKNGIFCSKSCSGEYRKGKLNPAWLGGVSFFPYPETFNNDLKYKIRSRDNFKCNLCGIPEVEYCKSLDVHHIDYNKANCSENNLISLCNICHLKTNMNRNYWTKYFTKQMEESWAVQK